MAVALKSPNLWPIRTMPQTVISSAKKFFGLDVHTVARGRQELFAEQVQRQSVRKKGGGRKPVEKNAGSDRVYCRPAQA